MPCRESSVRVRRVSSQSTRSASASSRSTRSVTSSRLPIGVAQTASGTSSLRASRTRSARRRPCPLPRRARPPGRGRDRVREAAHRDGAISSAGWSRRSNASPKPPPMTITSGSKALTRLAIPAPSIRPISVSASTARSSPSRAAATSCLESGIAARTARRRARSRRSRRRSTRSGLAPCRNRGTQARRTRAPCGPARQLRRSIPGRAGRRG